MAMPGEPVLPTGRKRRARAALRNTRVPGNRDKPGAGQRMTACGLFRPMRLSRSMARAQARPITEKLLMNGPAMRGSFSMAL